MTGWRGPGLLGRAVTAFVLTALLSVAGGGDSGRVPGCGPARGDLTVDDLPAGSSVIRCAAVGRLLTRDGVGVAVPEPGVTVAVEALTVDGAARGLTVRVAADGTVSYDDDHTASGDRAATGAGSRADSPAACDDSAFTTADRKEYNTYDWFIGDGPMPGGISRAEARRAFEDAIATITTSRNDCGFADTVRAKARFVAATHHEADVDAEARCTTRDGLNVWDAGDLSSGVVATTCSWSNPVPGPRPDQLIEADVRFNIRHYRFTNNPHSDTCDNAYDIRSVATHEAGHVFGLGHAGPGHGNLTMYANSYICSTSARTLGKGDVLGLRRLY
ncbi:matrixin family metalloprotease [Streptomyces antibioticus]|uniref:matrixin family metalloprotease n=1 Tax=Streptomyces antibioticus TaxID=1890 RepID=UPI0022514430|nr:matrixin family metalloprotease [Streptomyces antibioticus]MCX5171578.1 matrixin family metalloprotease [Streptomyces antibioticus]